MTSNSNNGAKPAAPTPAAAATPNTRRPLYSRGAQANPAENHLARIQQKLSDEQQQQQKQKQQQRGHNLGRQHQQQHQHRGHHSQPQAKGRQCQRDQRVQPTPKRFQTPRNPQHQQQPAIQCDGKCVEILKEYAVKIENLEKRLQELTTLITNLTEAKGSGSAVANPPTQTPAAAPTPTRPAANTQPDAAAVSEDSDMDCEALSDDGDDLWTDDDSFDDEIAEIIDAYDSYYSDVF
ncbi:transcriptional regulatory protein SEF1-like [Drosophila miranda]|uniref:transcriptional regulatory protein SEF1-like n=1 Tax=Drosophila miranda TaxID=7229 RepID=UPI00143F20E5|nr:transcriptional regulatory protein SEF1-like [Drosophila miranda]